MRTASGGEAASDALVHFLLDAVLAHEPGSEAYRFFVLQALTELVSSYMVCKQSFLRYGGDERGRAALGRAEILQLLDQHIDHLRHTVVRKHHELAMMQRASCGFGTSLTVTSIVTASMPSLPTTAASRSRPGTSSASLPNSIGSPSTV